MMKFHELIDKLGVRGKEVIVTLLKPVRNGDIYKQGRLVGFKPAIYGAKHTTGFLNGKSGSMSSPHLLKQAKVMVVYNIAEFGKMQHFDWVNIDNCTFEVVENKSDTNIMQEPSKNL